MRNMKNILPESVNIIKNVDYYLNGNSMFYCENKETFKGCFSKEDSSVYRMYLRVEEESSPWEPIGEFSFKQQSPLLKQVNEFLGKYFRHQIEKRWV
jgi:hypothetical protein